MFKLRGDMGVGVVFQPLAEEVREATQNLNGDLLELFLLLQKQNFKNERCYQFTLITTFKTLEEGGVLFLSIGPHGYEPPFNISRNIC